jgi:glycosyltransferase involved in cell wall biosynthesis/GT2 family glycosyltransferase/tetratricopeptide (TPR) repeat protein
VNRISLNVVVFNEEARLETCLVDARDHVDEIVVVDQMSTDATPEIAQRLADVYVRDVHHGHAEPSRELAASRSSGDWILILDADETMSPLLKRELRSLVGRGVDGYWIQKVNLVGGSERNRIQHFRLVRKARARFDPRPHGGAGVVTDNIDHFERTGIIHEKSVQEQVIDDARYEQIALEDDAPTSAKRNWLSHNRTLREERARRRRSDLEALVPAGARRVLILGEISIDLPGCELVRPTRVDLDAGAATASGENASFDAAILAPAGAGVMAGVRAVAGLVRPGGVIVGTAPAARNRRGMEEFIAAVLAGEIPPGSRPAGGSTRRELVDDISGAGLDVRWLGLIRDGWLDPVAVRPDGGGTVIEAKDFLLRSVLAEVAEELTAEEIVFAAVRPRETEVPPCSIILAARPGADPLPCSDTLLEMARLDGYELVVVQSPPAGSPIEGATEVMVSDEASVAARWNAGARAAAGELLVFLSTDSMPLPGWLDALLDAHRSRPDTGAVGSKLVAPDGTVEHLGLVLGPDRIPYRLYQGDAATAPNAWRPRIMPAVVGEGMVTARARFVEIGGFDERLGEDLTDADFCLRLRSRGLPIIYSPTAALQSRIRSPLGTRGSFRGSAREFAARWSPVTFRSDEVVCRADRRDANGEWSRSWRLPRPSGPGIGGLPAVAWTSHFLEGGGYTEEAIAAVEALEDAGLEVVANPVVWDRKDTAMPPAKAERLAALLERDLPDEFVHVAHIGADRFKRHPGALRNIGRTMFETDGLPALWRDQCNLMDEIWVPSEHNLQTFANAGVDASKLHKVPETFDAELFDPGVAPLAVEGLDGFVFLSMFSWIGRKAWDVLLRAWCKEFGAHDDVTLLLKTDTAISPPGTDCRREVDEFVRGQLKGDPDKGPRIVVLDRPLELTDLPRLYRAADAFVLASHGEGWGRPYMEAMAMGLPTIATGWSGNLEFMNEDNSYLVDYKLVPAPDDSWLRGQRWAQPSVSDLRRAMRSLYENRTQAAAIGQRARADVLVSCRPELVAEAVRARLEAIARHPVNGSGPKHAPRAPARPARKRPKKDRRRVTACVVVQDNEASLSRCLSSLGDVADATIVIDAGSGEDMASARNDALNRAIGGWVLMLDATHTLDPASVDLVRALIKKERFVGYAAREVHQFGLDGAVSAVRGQTALLFPRHPELRYAGRAEEQLLPQRPELGFRLLRSGLVLFQHDHRAECYDPVARARRHLPLLERSAREAGHEPFHLYNLGVALGHLGLDGEAETTLREAIALAAPGVIWEASAYASLSRALARQGRMAEAVKLGKTATKCDRGWADGWCMLGATLVDDGRPQAALRAYERALKCSSDAGLASGIPDETAWHVRAALARLHLQHEQYEQAAECLRGAVTEDPMNAELHVLLARAYEGLRRPKDAGRHLDRATTAPQAGPVAFASFGDFFTKKAEDALLRGLVDNAESRMLLERIERLRAARASGP